MKWHLALAAGAAVLGTTVTACANVTPTSDAALRTVHTPAAAAPRTTAPERAAAHTSAPASRHTSPAAQQPASSPTPVPAPPPVSHTIWFDCQHHGQVAPADYILTCADAGSVLGHLQWSTWTAAKAVATGVHELNDCTPNCAEGKFIQYPVVVTLWRSEPVPGHAGERAFTMITVRYTGQRPPAYTSLGRLIRHPGEWTEQLGPYGP
jgi:hypothetical protein